MLVLSYVQRSSHRFEQELDNLDVPLRLRQCFTPRVQTMTAKEKPVRVLVLIQHLSD
jgi:hypothetical protein